MIFAHTCPSCGYTDTPALIQLSQVISVDCMECWGHIRFCTPQDLPDLQEIKVAIFQAANGDLELIERAKRSMEFKPSQYADFAQVKYIRLYCVVLFLKWVKINFARITERITFVEQNK